MSRRDRSRTTAARAASLRSAELAAIEVVEGLDMERRKAEEEEVLDGDRRRFSAP